MVITTPGALSNLTLPKKQNPAKNTIPQIIFHFWKITLR
jgi:hypothetical protein